MQEKLISRRLCYITKDLPSARLTLTNELLDMGVDIETEEYVIVELRKGANGKKFAVIEKLIKEE